MSFLYSPNEQSISPSHNYMKTTIKEANGHIQSLFDRVNELEAERDDLLEMLNHKDAEISAFTSSMERLQDTSLQRELQVKSLQFTVAEQDAIIDQLQAKILNSGIEGQIAYRKPSLEEIQSNFEPLNSLKEPEIEEKIVALTVELGHAKSKISSQQEEITEQRQFIAAQLQACNDHLRETQILKNTLDEIMGYTSSLNNLSSVLKETRMLYDSVDLKSNSNQQTEGNTADLTSDLIQMDDKSSSEPLKNEHLLSVLTTPTELQNEDPDSETSQSVADEVAVLKENILTAVAKENDVTSVTIENDIPDVTSFPASNNNVVVDVKLAIEIAEQMTVSPSDVSDDMTSKLDHKSSFGMDSALSLGEISQ